MGRAREGVVERFVGRHRSSFVPELTCAVGTESLTHARRPVTMQRIPRRRPDRSVFDRRGEQAGGGCPVSADCVKRSGEAERDAEPAGRHAFAHELDHNSEVRQSFLHTFVVNEPEREPHVSGSFLARGVLLDRGYERGLVLGSPRVRDEVSQNNQRLESEERDKEAPVRPDRAAHSV